MPVPFTLANPELCCCNFGGHFYSLRHSDTVFLNEERSYNVFPVPNNCGIATVTVTFPLH